MKGEERKQFLKDRASLIAMGKRLEKQCDRNEKAVLKSFKGKATFLDGDMGLVKLELPGETGLLWWQDLVKRGAPYSDSMKAFSTEWQQVFTDIEKAQQSFIETLGYEESDTDGEGWKEWTKDLPADKNGTVRELKVWVCFLPTNNKMIQLVR